MFVLSNVIKSAVPVVLSGLLGGFLYLLFSTDINSSALGRKGTTKSILKNMMNLALNLGVGIGGFYSGLKNWCNSWCNNRKSYIYMNRKLYNGRRWINWNYKIF